MAIASNSHPDLFRDSAADLVAVFETIESTDIFVEYFYNCVRSAGFEHFLIGGVPSAVEPIAKMILLHNYPKNWVSRYIKMNYFTVDPVAQYCRETTEPFFWSEAAEHYGTAPGFESFMAEAPRQA